MKNVYLIWSLLIVAANALLPKRTAIEGLK